MSELDTIYSAEWFAHDFEGLQPEFTIAGNALVDLFKPATSIDVGCGPGMLVSALLDRGVHAVGFDGSRHAIDYAKEHVKAAWPCIALKDLRALKALPLVQAPGSAIPNAVPYDLVLCTEVAEHLDAADAPKLVALLCSGRSPTIVLTAARPGQEGNHHVNCQPPIYWIRLMLDHGYYLNTHWTELLKQAWVPLRRLAHMTRNVLVFRPEPF